MSVKVIPQNAPLAGDLVAQSQMAGVLPLRQSLYGTLEATYPEGHSVTYEITRPPAGTFETDVGYGNDIILPNFIYYPPETPGYGTDSFEFRIYDATDDVYSGEAIIYIQVNTATAMPAGRIGDWVKTDSSVEEVNVHSTSSYQSPVDIVRTYANEEVFGVIQSDPFCDIWVDNGLGGYTEAWRYRVLFNDSTEGWVVAEEVSLTPPVNLQSSITYYGVTWTFAAPVQVGAFVTGEPFVVGPVTVIAISPTWNGKNGSMVNPTPGGDHGFDSTINNLSTNNSGIRNYSAALNKALSLPLTLVAGDVLVSSKALVPEENPTKLDAVVALTVLATSPDVGSFRPPIWGNDRTVNWNEDMIDWGVLKNLTIPANDNLPYNWITYLVTALPWFEWDGHSDCNRMRPRRNIADGGREYGEQIAGKFGLLVCWLNTDQNLEQKKIMARQIIQNGLDIKAYIDNGGNFYHDGGHNCGRKLPAVFAAVMLQSSSFKSWVGNPTIFQEDQQTWIVTQEDTERVLLPLTGEWAGRPLSQYTQPLVGLGEWGLRHLHEPDEDNAHWDATYRNNNFNGMMPCWLAAELMEQEAVWDWPAAFAYMERVYGINQIIYAYHIHMPLLNRLWNLYHT